MLSVPKQTPSVQASPPVHGLPSSQPSVFGSLSQSPVAVLQESSVHGLSSSQLTVGTSAHSPALHSPTTHSVQDDSSQGSPSSAVTTMHWPPALQAPASHSSA